MTAPPWVFAYGSLLWNPGFTVAEQAFATLGDFSRSFCMRSIHHRGTPEHPGLVLALDAASGFVCRGVALRMADGDRAGALRTLRERELVSSAYIERVLPLTLDDGRGVEALTYVVDRNHAQYCGSLPLREQAEIIARSRGRRGSNADYLSNTVGKLDELGLRDETLDWLDARVAEINCG